MRKPEDWFFVGNVGNRQFEFTTISFGKSQISEDFMSSDLFDALTVALVVTVFSCLVSPTLVWLFTSHQQG
ncbi:hypothetical protein C7B61_08540 [filamentous cyanobacterium CCP1]|jgi:hypothetical protein|nr:hypothetical protein C7B76_00615 [filamentous cyanobacterium CCP2]PSB66982.1 hypothetical protein C7B61_08540 [filamentous cyanobacterium CCP1]